MSTHRSRPVRCIETGQDYPSITDAAILLNIDMNKISKQIHGHTKSAEGLHFELLYTPEPPKMKKRRRGCKKANICFECKNAVPSAKRGTGCPWSRNFEPVPGWTAEPVTLHQEPHQTETYRITACPRFERG